MCGARPSASLLCPGPCPPAWRAPTASADHPRPDRQPAAPPRVRRRGRRRRPHQLEPGRAEGTEPGPRRPLCGRGPHRGVRPGGRGHRPAGDRARRVGARGRGLPGTVRLAGHRGGRRYGRALRRSDRRSPAVRGRSGSSRSGRTPSGSPTRRTTSARATGSEPTDRRAGVPELAAGRPSVCGVAASWPQAPSISRPRVSRTVTGTPLASSRRTNSFSSCRRDAVQREPGVGFIGIRLTCTQPQLPRRRSTFASWSARNAWSLTSRIRMYSIETRRLVVLAYSQAASTHLVDVPPGVDRDQLVAQLVVGGVQRQGEGDRQPLGGQLLHPRHQADGGHRDPAGAQPEPVRGRGDQLTHRADHRLVVGQRLAHAHEDHVADPAATTGNRGRGLSLRSPSITCSTISAVLMLRCSPPWPVAQNGQAMPQPAWLDTHIVTRSG